MLAQAEFLADEPDILVVASILRIALDGLAVEPEGIQAADLDLPVVQSARLQARHHLRLPGFIDMARLAHEILPVGDQALQFDEGGVAVFGAPADGRYQHTLHDAGPSLDQFPQSLIGMVLQLQLLHIASVPAPASEIQD